MITDKELKQQLKLHFGFDSFKGNQEAIIKNVLNRRDTFVLMPTGGGKSLCYQLPALIMEGSAIVVSPLIALMKNQVDSIRSFSSEDGVAHFINSSLTKVAVEAVRKDIVSGKTKMLYVAPEYLVKEDFIDFLKQIKISFVAVDEAHCVSEWGHDFRPEYRNIKTVVDKLDQDIHIIALTATATPKVQHDIQKSLGMMEADIFKSSFNRPNLYYEVRPKTPDIDKEIIKFIKSQPGKSGIVYCLSRKKVDEFAETLRVNGITALAYHAGMDNGTRSNNQDSFLMERVDVIVATIAFGMGIDKPDVRYVIHYDMSKSLEGYYQETGRAGRDGGEGRCIAFYSKKDLQKLEKFMQKKTPTEQEIGRQLLKEISTYAETTLCRRMVLLKYFGEEYTEENCCNCDNCLNPKKQVEAKDLLCNVLETVQALKGNIRIQTVVDIIMGNASEDEEGEDEEGSENGSSVEDIETFGSGKDEDESKYQTVIQQAIAEGYLETSDDDNEIISITSKGTSFVKHPKSFKIADEDAEDDEDADEANAEKNAKDSLVDEAMLTILKNLRKKVAEKEGQKPYIIFQDPSLEAMATTYPISIEELANVPGVGAGKAKRYGEEFVKAIKKYVDDNEIERPQDLVIRSPYSNSKLKVSIIQDIDRKIPLDSIAEKYGIDFEDLLTEIESIVKSGSKINIDYFINSVIPDSDRVYDIYDYFKEDSESDDLDEAVESLGGDYTEDEIRLVRIKFLSQEGN